MKNKTSHTRFSSLQ